MEMYSNLVPLPPVCPWTNYLPALSPACSSVFKKKGGMGGGIIGILSHEVIMIII